MGSVFGKAAAAAGQAAVDEASSVIGRARHYIGSEIQEVGQRIDAQETANGYVPTRTITELMNTQPELFDYEHPPRPLPPISYVPTQTLYDPYDPRGRLVNVLPKNRHISYLRTGLSNSSNY